MFRGLQVFKFWVVCEKIILLTVLSQWKAAEQHLILLFSTKYRVTKNHFVEAVHYFKYFGETNLISREAYVLLFQLPALQSLWLKNTEWIIEIEKIEKFSDEICGKSALWSPQKIVQSWVNVSWFGLRSNEKDILNLDLTTFFTWWWTFQVNELNK